MRITLMADHQMKLLVCMVSIFIAQVCGHDVPITILDNLVSKGAVCLDGSPPAYHFEAGVGNGTNNWMVYLMGGGWCFSEKDCIDRVNNPQMGLGSSKLMPKNVSFDGLLSPFPAFNPNFYNWNRVYVRYCDGASFSADVEEVNPQNNLHFRGQRIFNAIVEIFLEKGMKNADNAILAGSSAGGMATMLQCDNFRTLLPNVPRVKCLSDAGFFFHGKELSDGTRELRENYFGGVVNTHQLSSRLDASCTSKMDAHLCIFPENFIGDLQTPLFILNSGFDGIQFQYWSKAVEPKSTWSNCYLYGPQNCTSEQKKAVQDFQASMIKAISENIPPSRGLFIDSCSYHEQASQSYRWNGLPRLNNKTMTQAFSDWYFDQSPFQQIENYEFTYNCTIGHPK